MNSRDEDDEDKPRLINTRVRKRAEAKAFREVGARADWPSFD